MVFNIKHMFGDEMVEEYIQKIYDPFDVMPIRLRKCAVTGSAASAANAVFKSSICTASSTTLEPPPASRNFITSTVPHVCRSTPQIRFSPVVSHPLFSPFLHGIFLPWLLLFCRVLSGFPHPSTTTRLPAQSQAPETAPLLKSSESPPQMWQVLCWSDSQIPGATLFSPPVPHTFWYKYGIHTAFFRSAQYSARRASYGCRRH